MPNEDIDPLDAARVMQPDTGVAERRPKRPKAEVALIEVAPPTRDAVPVPVFRVIKDARVSWGKQMIKLKANALISEAVYGTGAIEQFRAKGLELEQVV